MTSIGKVINSDKEIVNESEIRFSAYFAGGRNLLVRSASPVCQISPHLKVDGSGFVAVRHVNCSLPQISVVEVSLCDSEANFPNQPD